MQAIVIALTAMFFFLVSIGIFVYKDAKRRGMPAFFWALTAVLLPGLSGLIVYIVYRAGKKPTMSCKSCNKDIEWGIGFCPYCGFQSPPPDKPYKAAKGPRWSVCLVFASSAIFFCLSVVIIVRLIDIINITKPGAYPIPVQDISAAPTSYYIDSSNSIPIEKQTELEINLWKERQLEIIYELEVNGVSWTRDEWDGFSYYMRIGNTIESYNKNRYYYSRAGLFPENYLNLQYRIPIDAKEITIDYAFTGSAAFNINPMPDMPPKSSYTERGNGLKATGSFTYDTRAFIDTGNNIIYMNIEDHTGAPFYNIDVSVSASY